MAIQADSCGFRFIVLFFNCILTFGSSFCFDMPSVLQAAFEGNITCTNTTSQNASCPEGLGMSASSYNLLYAVYAWANAVVVIGAGFLIDKVGNKVGAVIFSGICVIGSSTFAAGIFFQGTSALLPVMLVGRLLFGSGLGALTIVQRRITVYWFRDKELAMAFGIRQSISRLGSVLNFLFTQQFADTYGLSWTLWGGAMLCVLGFVSAITVSILDAWGTRQLGDDETLKEESRKVRVSDVGKFPSQFWVIALMIMFFWNGIFPFVADATKFIQDKYDYSPTTASYMAGSVYDVSLIIAPFLGGMVDVVGKRGYIAFSCALLTIPVFALLAFTNIHPLVSTIWLGFTYSFACSAMWPSLPLVVTQAYVGTAFGLVDSIQQIGIGISNILVGQMLGKTEGVTQDEKVKRWQHVMMYFLANTIACVACCMALNIIDKRTGGVLNQSRREKQLKEELAETSRPNDDDEGDDDDGQDDDDDDDPLLGNNSTSINASVHSNRTDSPLLT